MQQHLLSGYVTLSHKIMRPFHKQQFIRIGSVFSLLFLGGWGVGGALGLMGSRNWIPLALLAKNYIFLDMSKHFCSISDNLKSVLAEGKGYSHINNDFISKEPQGTFCVLLCGMYYTRYYLTWFLSFKQSPFRNWTIFQVSFFTGKS